ncbi:MAG: hypothetical protein DMF60_14805, partial [Acidobacteria bacterium]
TEVVVKYLLPNRCVELPKRLARNRFIMKLRNYEKIPTRFVIFEKLGFNKRDESTQSLLPINNLANRL